MFYDFLVEDGLRDMNPVGRGCYTPRRQRGGHQRGLVPRVSKLPWIPAESDWLRIHEVVAKEPIRNRFMLALAYDAALRREELCSLRTDNLDPAYRTLRVRVEATKNRLGRRVPYSASTGVLMSNYLVHRARLGRVRGRGRCSCRSPGATTRNPCRCGPGRKVVREIALAAGVPGSPRHHPTSVPD